VIVAFSARVSPQYLRDDETRVLPLCAGAAAPAAVAGRGAAPTAACGNQRALGADELFPFSQISRDLCGLRSAVWVGCVLVSWRVERPRLLLPPTKKTPAGYTHT
jgi:hypothetical protein